METILSLMDAQKAFLVVVIGLLGFTVWSMAQPFLPYILSAVIIGFVLHPVHVRLKEYMPEQLSAFLLLFLTVFMAILPMILVSATVLEDVHEIADGVENIGYVDFGPLEEWFEEVTGQSIDIRQHLSDAVESLGSFAVGGFSQALNLILGVSLGVLVLFFMIYYILKDGEEFLEWLKYVTPVRGDIQEDIYRKTRKSTWAVMKGHVLVAIAQGVIAGIGLFAVGIPNFAFWTFVMIVLAFIPVIGVSLVWAPASIYLFLTGEPVFGVSLALYGIVVVSLSDYVLRPLVVDRASDIHPAGILVGVLGGMFLFGAPGLFIGPVIIGVLGSVVNVYSEEYGVI